MHVDTRETSLVGSFFVLTRRNWWIAIINCRRVEGGGHNLLRGRTHYFAAFGGNLMTYTHGSRILKQKKREGTG